MYKSITIFNHTFDINCAQSDEVFVDKAVHLLNGRLSELSKKNKNSEKILLMSVLSLLAEQLKVEKNIYDEKMEIHTYLTEQNESLFALNAKLGEISKREDLY